MKTRLHHKVAPASIYHNPVLDAPWPLKEYLVRLGLFALELLSLVSWCTVPAFIDAAYVSGWGVLWEKISPLAFIFGLGLASAALVLSINPCAVKLTAFKRLLSWTSPPVVIFYHLPRLAGRLLRSIGRLFWPAKAPRFVERFLFVLFIEVSVLSWWLVPYIAHHWIRFSLERWDRAFVFAALAAVPLSFVINLFLNQLRSVKAGDDKVLNGLLLIFAISNPAVLFYNFVFKTAVMLVCGAWYGRGHLPKWLV